MLTEMLIYAPAQKITESYFWPIKNCQIVEIRLLNMKINKEKQEFSLFSGNKCLKITKNRAF